MLESLTKPQFAIMISLFAVIVISVIAGIIVSLKKKEYLSFVGMIGTLLSFGLLIALIIVSIFEKYSEETVGDKGKELWLYILTVAMIGILFAFTLLSGKKQECNHTKSIVYAAVMIALSFALSYISIFKLPSGGSVTLASLLPIMLYSNIFGIRKGVIVGIIYGILQFIQEPYFMHPMQFLLDYPLAFGSIGICGFFREKNIFKNKYPIQFALGGVIAVILRYLSHVISGIFVFGSGDPENYGAVSWSFLYNSFTLADMAIVIVVGVGLLASKSIVKLLDNAKK